MIDGQEVATAPADQRGRAEVELDVKMPALPHDDKRYGMRFLEQIRTPDGLLMPTDPEIRRHQTGPPLSRDFEAT